MAATCKLLSFASVILNVSLYCLALCYPWLSSWWVCLTKGMPQRLSAAYSWERGMCLELPDDPSVFVVDAEGQIARFVTKLLRVCSRLVVLTYFT